jgi:GT2 family glycosyltransferase
VVTYGSRLSLFLQTVKAILDDKHVTRLVVVDNASSFYEELCTELSQYGDRVKIIRHEKNLGSAGGFARGIEAAREEQVDYIYLSDDDVVISENFVGEFEKAHRILCNSNAVLCARRASFWAGTDVHYTTDLEVRPRKYFNILRPRILLVFLGALLGLHKKHIVHEPRSFFPIVPSRGWAYAGVLIPVEAAREALLPDASLGLYLDDIVYSWGVIDAGYPTFALMEPHLTDLELTHAGAHTSSGLFAPAVSSTKIYYETRNRVRVSLMFGEVKSLAVFKLQVFIWCVGVCGVGILKHGVRASTLSRMKLIIEALRAGFDKKRIVPQNLAVKI